MVASGRVGSRPLHQKAINQHGAGHFSLLYTLGSVIIIGDLLPGVFSVREYIWNCHPFVSYRDFSDTDQLNKEDQTPVQFLWKWIYFNVM